MNVLKKESEESKKKALNETRLSKFNLNFEFSYFELFSGITNENKCILILKNL